VVILHVHKYEKKVGIVSLDFSAKKLRGSLNRFKNTPNPKKTKNSPDLLLLHKINLWVLRILQLKFRRSTSIRKRVLLIHVTLTTLQSS